MSGVKYHRNIPYFSSEMTGRLVKGIKPYDENTVWVVIGVVAECDEDPATYDGTFEESAFPDPRWLLLEKSDCSDWAYGFHEWLVPVTLEQ